MTNLTTKQKKVKERMDKPYENILHKTNEVLRQIDDLLKEIGDPTTPATFFIKKFRQIIKDNYYDYLRKVTKGKML